MAKYKFLRYVGDGMYYVICGQSGRKIRAKDAVLVTDRFSSQNGLVVHKDEVDVTNPQSYIKAVRERQIKEPKMVRPESEDRFGFISSVSEITAGDSSDPTGRAPSAPKNLSINSGTSTTANLTWQGPDDSGSNTISGYKVERESPVGGGFTTIKSNTGSGVRTYIDTGLTASTVYNYRVSAINAAGTSGTSNEASYTTPDS